MVSTSPTVNGATGSAETSIPPGRYHVVGWDLDTTGRRLIDEICQIAAFSPASKFSQYVMPHRDISIGAQRRHNIRVVTIGRYRMLKDSTTGKILKTKSEISALTDFLQWLEDLRGSSLDGIILINHEPFKVAAPLLLESLRRYNLLDRFSAVVKGFVNGYSVAEAKCAKTVRFFSLRTLSKLLLNKEANLDNAASRSELIYEIAHRLCVEDDKPDETSGGNGDCAIENSNLILGKAIYKFGVSLEVEEKAIDEIKLVLDRQKSLTPVFAAQLRLNLRLRQKATVLRRLLAVAGVDLATLAKNYAEDGNAGIDNILATLSAAKPRELVELKDMLLRYFDPSYKPPVDIKPRNNRQRKPRKESTTETSSNATKTVSSPDASSASTSARSETNSPAKVQDIAEQSVAKVETDGPKPQRSEMRPTVNRQQKNEEVSVTKQPENKRTIPDVLLSSQESKPAMLESSPVLPELKPASHEPSSTVPEPASTLPKPASTLPEPASTLPKPASTLPEPASTSPEPASTLHEPASTLHEPASTLPEPASTLPEPASTLPEPASTLPEPASTIPEPASTLPESTSPLPEPLSAELKSVSVEPPKTPSVSSDQLQQEQNATESKVEQKQATSDSPAS